jgi:hypothetical protein
VTTGHAAPPALRYPRTMRPHPTRFILLLALLVAAGMATAQIDDRARELLEGLQTGEQADIRTLDQTMIATIYAHGMEQTVRTRTQVDYEGRRAAIETEPAPGMSIRIVVADGQTRVFMGGMAVPMPPGMDDAYGSVFEREPDLFADGVSASYDGFQRYGDLLAGHQVTVRNAAVLPGVEGAQEQRLIFDDDGRLAGFVAEVAEAGVMVGVFDEPLRGNPFVGRDATMHLLLDDGTTQPFMRMRFEDARVNEPIDPAAFE